MTEFLISIFYFVFFCFIISKQNFFKDEHIPKYWIYSLFGLKVIISIVLTAIYTKYYTSRETADIYKYFDDSKIMFEALKHKPLDYIKMLFAIDNDNEYFDSNYYNSMLHWVRPYSSDLFSDSHIIIRFNAFVRLFSFGYFQVHNVFMNFISLIGLLLIYKALKQFLVDKERALFYILSFTPSLLFWGSGLLKEGIILFGLGILLYSINRPIHFKVILFIALSVVILLYTKFYLLVALFIPTLGFTIVRFTKLKPLYSYSIAFICFIALICVLPLINNDWSIVNQIVSKQQTFSRFITQVETNSGFIIPELSNISTIIRNIPNALLNTFIRPFPWECNSFFIFLCQVYAYCITFLC